MLDDIEHLVGQPEGPTLEYKASIPPPAVIAQNLAAFANSDGGLLVLGVAEASGRPVVCGVDVTRAATAIDKALRRIDPELPRVRRRALRLDGETVYAIEVPSSRAAPHLVAGQPYVRQGDQATVVTPDRASLLVRLDQPPEDRQGQLENLARAVADQGELIKQLLKASSFPRQLTWAVFGAVLGTVLGVLATILLG